MTIEELEKANKKLFEISKLKETLKALKNEDNIHLVVGSIIRGCASEIGSCNEEHRAIVKKHIRNIIDDFKELLAEKEQEFKRI